MTEKMLAIIRRDFNDEQSQLVKNELSSIDLTHVMAASETNLETTRLAILKLAKGDLSAVVKLTESAKADFRDVIMWASNNE